MTTIGSGERYPDLSPEELHQTQERIALAFGEAFAAVLAEDEFGHGETVEIIEAPGAAEGEIVIPHQEGHKVARECPR